MVSYDSDVWTSRDAARGKVAPGQPRPIEPMANLRFLRSGGGYNAGETAVFPESEAAPLIRMQRAERIVVEAPADPPADKAMAPDVAPETPARRGRARSVTK